MGNKFYGSNITSVHAMRGDNFRTHIPTVERIISHIPIVKLII